MSQKRSVSCPACVNGSCYAGIGNSFFTIEVMNLCGGWQRFPDICVEVKRESLTQNLLGLAEGVLGPP